MHYNFTVRFFNEAALPMYKGLKAGESVLLSNTYPANIGADMLNNAGIGTVQVYSYDDKSYHAVENTDAVIQSQHSFVFTPNAEMDLQILKGWLLNTEVAHRSAEEEIPFMRVEIRNEAKNTASNVYVAIDENKGDVPNLAVDAPKLFAAETAYLPDMYVMRYDEKWAGIHVPTAQQPIPLGVRVKNADETFTFSLLRTNMTCDVLLDDTKTGKTYNLSNGEKCQVSDLKIGDNEGRFYLFLSEDPNGYLPDEDISTALDPTLEQGAQIYIYNKGEEIVVSSTEGIELQQISIMDMAGRHQVYQVSGRYVVLSLPLNSGIYVVQAVGDNATKTEKIQVK
jgi:hypothetical protein